MNNYRKLSKVTKYVIGSGFCAGHNVKLERSVKEKTTSYIDKEGRLKWLVREVTSLTCPANKPKILTFGDVPAVLKPEESVGTNGKRRNLSENVVDQPQLTRTSNTENED